MRVPLHRGPRFVVDTQRLWHVVCHTGAEPRYALISSFESGPALDAWIASKLALITRTPSPATGELWCTTIFQLSSPASES